MTAAKAAGTSATHVGLQPPALTWTSSLSGFCPWACFRRTAPATCANDLPLETATNRSAPMACGPDVDQARPARGGQRRSARRGPLAGNGDPRRLPPTSEPRHHNRLVRGSPGGVWARDITLYRRAVPGHRHGGTPGPCRFKPRSGRLRAWGSSRWSPTVSVEGPDRPTGHGKGRCKPRPPCLQSQIRPALVLCDCPLGADR